MRKMVGLILLVSAASAPANAERKPANLARSTNAEMTSIFDADQAAREAAKIDWPVVREDDRLRRARTQSLLDEGKLSSADDFYHAAYIFQHGDLPEDCLKAHAIAVVAAALGKTEAAWIAAATLDRYLQRIGQPQVYGTQYVQEGGSPWTQEPYRRDLLSDALRVATGVPTISKQQDRLKEMNRNLPK
jgi:hypothetical protein